MFKVGLKTHVILSLDVGKSRIILIYLGAFNLMSDRGQRTAHSFISTK